MKICVVGAGAIGGLLAVKLADAGHDVSVIIRGANLAAVRANGMTLRIDGRQINARVAATDNLAEPGAQDVVILALKAHQVAPIAADIASLCHEDTVIIPMQNGIPWWYFQRHGGEFDGRIVTSVDPDGAVAAAVDPRRLIGCVVYPACELAAPGVVRHIEGDRFPLGELDGTTSDRANALSETFARAGLKAPILDNIRAEIWLKLWGNLTFNPISALTHSTLVDICQFPLTRELAAAMMREAQAVANRLGIAFRVSLDKRIAGAERVGKHKTSMLQDVEAGRDPEIDALVGSVIEVGRIVGEPTPTIEAVFALVKLLARTMREEKVYIRAHPFLG